MRQAPEFGIVTKGQALIRTVALRHQRDAQRTLVWRHGMHVGTIQQDMAA